MHGRSAVPVHEESDVRRSLSTLYTSIGRIHDARQVLENGINDDSRLVIPYVMSLLPVIPESEAAIATSRSETMSLIDALIEELSAGRLTIAASSGASTARYIDMGYLLTYHGFNDELFRRKIGLLHALAYPELLSIAPHVRRAFAAQDRAARKAAAGAAARGAVAVPPHLPSRSGFGTNLAVSS